MFSDKPLVLVLWRDAAGTSFRAYLDDLEKIKPYINTNIGWLVDKNDDRLILAHGYSETGEVDVFTIPSESVVEIKIIKKKI